MSLTEALKASSSASSREVGLDRLLELDEGLSGLLDLGLTRIGHELGNGRAGVLHRLGHPVVLTTEVGDQRLVRADLPQRGPEDRLLAVMVVVQLPVEMLPGPGQLARPLLRPDRRCPAVNRRSRRTAAWITVFMVRCSAMSRMLVRSCPSW